MIISLQQIVVLVTTYKYALLFPLSILEGPIVTVIGGFLTSIHIMNWLVVYCVVITGDIIGDTFYYSFGRWGSRFFKKHGHRIGITPEKLESAKQHFINHHHKAIIASKLFQGIGVSGIVAAGILKIPYVRFIKTCLVISFVQSAIFLVIGIFFGKAYEQIGLYFNNYVAITSLIILVAITLIILFTIKKNNFITK
jgi:membrane protein DedA with SNARE-associated domain